MTCLLSEFGQHCSSPLLTQQLNQLSRELIDLLKTAHNCRLPLSKFIPSYHHHFGRQCRVADYGYTKLMELFEALPHVVQVSRFRDPVVGKLYLICLIWRFNNSY